MEERQGPTRVMAPPVTEPVPDSVPFVPPQPIFEVNFAFAQSCALLAAVELDLFTWMATGIESVSSLAEQAQASPGALARLLGALQGMGFVERTPCGYALTPLSARYLVRGRETYIGDVSLQTRQEWDAWIHLTDVVRTGRSVRCVNEAPLAGPFFEPLVEHLFPLIYPLMKRLVQRLGVGTRHQGGQVVDLGAGTAPGAIAVLECDPAARAVAIDFPAVLARAQAHARAHGVDGRMEYWPITQDTIALPPSQFHVAIASHVFRIVGPEATRQLIRQCYHALKPSGQLVVVEMYKEEDRFGSLFPHVVSLNMLVNTRHGDAFSSRQLCCWLQDAGFQVDLWHDYGPHPVVVATRPQT
jgi:2-polyprenyl-3-methyl-5-hydroxy-6-metoxy-1,4-benzoquinol methylase